MGYDEIERCEFVRCINCGARPYHPSQRAETQARQDKSSENVVTD